MPIFNLETSIDDLNVHFKDLLASPSYRFSYSTISIVELKWIMINLSKKGKDRDILEKQFSESLASLKFDSRFIETSFMDPIINDISYELTKLGHNDYFDTVIASNALWLADIFLTEDEPLKTKIESLIKAKTVQDLKPIQILSWNKIKKLI